MSSKHAIDPQQEVVTITRQYLRRERLASTLLVALVLSLFLGTYLQTSLLPALGVAVILVGIVRVPVFQSQGTFRLRTSDDLTTVVDSFTGPTPPVLAFQWGIAETATTGEESITYTIPYLFGLRAATMTINRQTETEPDGTRRVELEITENGRQWGTYTATIRSGDDQTLVDVQYTSNRRFGVGRLPQYLLATRYRDDVLTAQGYEIVSRDAAFGL